MTPAEFLSAVEGELRLQGARFDRGELEAYINDAWPLVADNPDPIAWAYAYISEGRATLPA